VKGTCNKGRHLRAAKGCNSACRHILVCQQARATLLVLQKEEAPRDADLAADFLASQVLVLEVALQDVLLCRQHDGGDSHPELL
jgi:hypothetical protein